MPFAGPEPDAHQAVGVHARCGVRRYRRRVLRGAPGLVNPESFTFIESALISRSSCSAGWAAARRDSRGDPADRAAGSRAGFAEYRMLIFGLVMVLMMMWRPQGLLPASRPHVELPQ